MRAAAIVTFATTLVIGTVDLLLLAGGGREATISHVILQGATVSPLLPFAFGVLMGHWFWPQRIT